ncbi:PhzF family phenazine biosynthesis protein [Clostridium sp. MSJ-11]|uniref:PhzF family phenazine biosynthesis protein n=1 Tax=Clostridium mobile TaxID=2841512 RepID=A0ABS6EEX0_9CLOT|nr:PhzF family phenazine biosynthesis protein [Clostridium mobile]MBU5483765.1 PhzF family phenazine biosynthesis protein [Clostridium mobile]
MEKNKLPIYIVDAFAKEAFGGNPAGVCILNHSIEDKEMQLIAKEINLSETAFVTIDENSLKNNEFNLRWFTPKVEVSMCGHGTLATAQVLFEEIGVEENEIKFQTQSGVLVAKKGENGIVLDFPIDKYEMVEVPVELLKAMGIENCKEAAYGKNTKKLILRVEKEEEVLKLTPNFEGMKNLNFNIDVKGVGVTTKGREYDFITRYFNPWAGINEDPVTGTVHTALAKYWGDILGKREFKAYQASDRGGEIIIKIIENGRMEMIGKGIIMLKGEINF